MAIFFWILIIICSAMILVFIVKELWRNKDDVLKEFSKKDSKKNLNDLLGISKTTFLTTIVNLIIISLAFLSFIETSNQNKETSLINKRSLEISENLLNIINHANEK